MGRFTVKATGKQPENNVMINFNTAINSILGLIIVLVVGVVAGCEERG